MKIVYITAALPFGTGEAFAIGEIDHLRQLGHEVLVTPVYPRGEVVHVPGQWLEGVRRENLISAGVVRSLLGELAKSPRAIWSAWSAIARSRNPRVFTKNAGVFPKGVWVGRLAQEWGANHIHAYWAGCAATVGLIASRCSGIPWSFTAHRWDIAENNLLGVKAESASFIRLIAEDGLRLAKAAGAASMCRKARVLHLGVPLPGGTARQTTEADGTAIVLCPANLTAVKGHANLLRTIGLLRDRGFDCELWLAGDGGLRSRLEARVKTLRLEDRVRFLGEIPHERLLDLYGTGAVRCVALASEIEGIPVSLMEAMSFSVPVVATAVGGTPELLSGGCGVLVPAGNPGAMADGIGELLLDPIHAARVGKAGRQRIESGFAIERNTEALSLLFAASAASIGDAL